ncbi:NAD(P)H-binding protein [Allobranchiibius sp. GilTou73]|uniref:NAD(P)H-binding protein n=1 Tax=Allobranchiibius sp. GilTou73 TaxID=2904523 RepID=UPI001F1EB409|nr:NAD(P)H-binding protein [Allobranchiibius sp. GilTou73]UIJ35928.1 NAD(P)H-binding protein [Allobranchiibius sp. GilTou73]
MDTVTPGRALVLGATGYVGSRLVPQLLDAGWSTRVMSRHPQRLTDRAWSARAEIVGGDASSADDMATACADVDVVYYLLHSMDGTGDFAQRDRDLANVCAQVAADAGVRRIVYLGALHPSGPLSPHLASRVEVGEILLAAEVPTTVLQAAVVLGAGSASFELLRHLSARLIVAPAPDWVLNSLQPIAIRDALHYLVESAAMGPDVNRSFDIGGPDVLSYRDMVLQYADIAGLRRRHLLTLQAPKLLTGIAGEVVGRLTPVPRGVAAPLVGSLVHEVICHEHDIEDLIEPELGGLLSFELAVLAALENEGRGEPGRLPEPGAQDPAYRTSADPTWAG